MIETLQTPANLTQIVYQHLWHEIASLHLMPGEKLSEVNSAAAAYRSARQSISWPPKTPWRPGPSGAAL